MRESLQGFLRSHNLRELTNCGRIFPFVRKRAIGSKDEGIQDEEVLEVEEPEGFESGDTDGSSGEDTVPKRYYC